MGAVIYCRISNDATGEAVGVLRQERECRALAERRGLDIDDVLVDNDLSAYSGVTRPAYQTLLELLRLGRVEAVVAWHPDRLHRSLRELEEFIAVLEAQAVEVHTVTAGDVDLSTPIGRMIARQLGTFARYESEHRSERSVAGKRDAARRGRWSSADPYGYRLVRDAAGHPVGDGRLVVVPEQARVIREAARRVLLGDTVYSICQDFNARGLRASRGGPWRTPSLRSILVSPTAAGLREYRGTVVGPGLWEPILTSQQHQALRTRLSDNRRTKGVRGAWKYLLTGGLIMCGKCGNRLYTQVRSTTHRQVYTCIPGNDKEGCAGVCVVAAPVEALVIDAVFDRFGADTMRLLVANPRAFARELQRRTAVESRMLELADTYATGEISRAEWLAARQPLRKQLSSLPDDPAHLGGLTLGNPDELRRQWHKLPIDRRRAFLQLVIDVVVVHPARHTGGKFDPHRVEVRWR